MINSEAEIFRAKAKLAHYYQIWGLNAGGDVFFTNSALLQPVIYQGTPAMLKIAMQDEERRAFPLMVHWKAAGAVRILQHSEDALLMERAEGKRSLAKMVLDGSDDEASRIICGVAAKLHQTVALPILPLIPLTEWFQSLFLQAPQIGGVFNKCAEVARFLLDNPEEEVVLHGDIHHGNILDAGKHGWLAIDPKALYGERGFDFANLFCNPDMATALSAGRMSQQIEVVSSAANLDPKRLLQWIIAWSALSAVWMIEDKENIEDKLKLIAIALSST